MANNGVLVVPFDIDMTDPAAVLAAARYIPQSDLPGPFCDLDYDDVLYPVGAGVDADQFIYKGVSQVLTDPADLLHYWSLRAPERNSTLLAATLRRTSDGVEAHFACDARGYLPRDEVLAWAGASAVTVPRLWGSSATQLGPELLTNGSFDASIADWVVVGNATAQWSSGEALVDVTGTGGGFRFEASVPVVVDKVYRLRFNARYGTFAGDFQTIANNGLPTVVVVAPQMDIVFVATGTLVAIRVARLTATTGTVFFDNFSFREVLTANAVQTTTANQPPIDLTANPLRIGAAASTSLVATIPSALTDAIDLRCSGGNVYEQLKTFTGGATYNVVSDQALCERAILAADTPREDIDAVKRNMARAWRAVNEVQLGQNLVPVDFSNPGLFSIIGDWQVSNNVATILNPSIVSRLNANPLVYPVLGKAYVVTLTITQISAARAVFANVGQNLTSRSTIGTFVETAVCTDASVPFRLSMSAGTGLATVSFWSVKEVIGGL